jgi:pilus assembly protein Flp/PilA
MLQNFFAIMLAGRKDDEKGATAVEYGLLVALIAAVIIATVVILGGQINTAFEEITSRLPGGGA